MYVWRNWRWIVLTIAFGLAAPAGQAGMITPDSIPNPPSAVDPAQGAPVYLSNVVTTQYKGLGLNFSSSGTAITSLNGTSVWTPTEWLTHPGSSTAGSPPGNYPVSQINYSGRLIGGIVSAGSLNPTTVSSLAVELVGDAAISMSVYGLHDQILNIAPVITSTGGAKVWTFTGPSISGFSVFPLNLPPPLADGGVWGVSEVSLTSASTPEPSSLLLVGLGALGLANRLGWRRIRQVA